MPGCAGLDMTEAGGGVAGAFLALRGSGLVHSHEGRGVQAAWLNRLLRGVPYVITRRVQKGPTASALNRRMYGRRGRRGRISEAIRARPAAARCAPARRGDPQRQAAACR